MAEIIAKTIIAVLLELSDFLCFFTDLLGVTSIYTLLSALYS